MVRKQIMVTESVDARIRRLAAQRGLSQSALISEAVRQLPDGGDLFARMRPFQGVIKGGSENLSDRVDEIYQD